ncbi:MAG TPA: enolase C-terminal domain-like protein [Alphaproteobacteria bacterium]|nr:enolase C-terminal domain-like protein [Alphaproteobacteria bacterium]
MKIVDIREATVPIGSPIRNADIAFDTMTASALAVMTDIRRGGAPVVGLAFDSIGRYGHGALLRERFIPRLLAAAPDDYLDDETGTIDPFKVWAIVMRNEKPGGHGERAGAVGLIDAAVWDLVAKLEERPLWAVLADRFGSGAGGGPPRVSVYAAGGHYRAGGDLDGLAVEIAGYRERGYRRVKIKIGGAPLDEDRRRIEAALTIVGSGDELAVDGNGSFDRDTAFAYADALDPLGLAWLEEPVDPLDFTLHAELAAHTATPIGTGENLFSAADTRNLMRHGGLRPDRDFIQLDISLSYGLVEYLRVLETGAQLGWARDRFLPHVGHLLALSAAAGLGLAGCEAAPDPALPFGGFPDDVQVEDGRVRPSARPGVGIEGKANLYALFRDRLALEA